MKVPETAAVSEQDLLIEGDSSFAGAAYPEMTASVISALTSTDVTITDTYTDTTSTSTSTNTNTNIDAGIQGKEGWLSVEALSALLSRVQDSISNFPSNNPITQLQRALSSPNHSTASTGTNPNRNHSIAREEEENKRLGIRLPLDLERIESMESTVISRTSSSSLSSSSSSVSRSMSGSMSGSDLPSYASLRAIEENIAGLQGQGKMEGEGTVGNGEDTITITTTTTNPNSMIEEQKQKQEQLEGGNISDQSDGSPRFVIIADLGLAVTRTFPISAKLADVAGKLSGKAAKRASGVFSYAGKTISSSIEAVKPYIPGLQNLWNLLEPLDPDGMEERMRRDSVGDSVDDKDDGDTSLTPLPGSSLLVEVEAGREYYPSSLNRYVNM